MGFLKAKGDEVFIDVGAHIGKYTITVAKILKDGLVLAFEPNPNNYRILLKNVKLNRLKNVIALKLAAWKSPTVLKLYLSEKGGNHSLKVPHEDFVYVYGKPIDEVVNELGLNRIDWVKIDVEGAELEVVKGLRRTIKKFRPQIIIEAEEESVLKFLKQMNYTISIIPPKILKMYYCKCKSEC